MKTKPINQKQIKLWALVVFIAACGIAIVVGSFKGLPVPAEVWGIINMLIGGGVVAAAIGAKGGK
jgi:hypothetical protein